MNRKNNNSIQHLKLHSAYERAENATFDYSVPVKLFPIVRLEFLDSSFAFYYKAKVKS